MSTAEASDQTGRDKPLGGWTRRWLSIILLLSLLARLAAVTVLDLKTQTLTVGFSAASSGEQAQMARGLLSDGEFTFYHVSGRPAPSAYQPPLYPMFLAAVFAGLGDGAKGFIAVQIIQSVLGALTVLLAFTLARMFLGDRGALLAAGLVGIWPAFVYMPNEAHPISFLIPILLWASVLMARISSRGPSLGSFLWLAFALALSSLIRSEILVPGLIGLGILLLQHRRRALPGVAICLVTVSAVSGAWMAHNYGNLGRPVLTTTLGLNLFRGNGPTATGGSYQWDGTIVWETPETIRLRKELPWSRDYEVRLDAVYMNALKASLRSDPLRPFRLLPAKFFYFWTTDFTHPKGRSPLVWGPWLILLPAIVVGMRSLWRQRRSSWPLYLWTSYYLLVVLVFFALPRYRMIVEPLFLIFAAAGILHWAELRRRSGRNRDSAGGASL